MSNSAIVGLSNLTMRNGIASGGGGILNWGKLTIAYSTISGNIAGSESSAVGGGIFSSGTLTINNSTLSGNSGSSRLMYGGAIYNSGTLTINNSTISGNSAYGAVGGGGGGIYNASVAKINNSTIGGNGGSPFGGGIFNGGTATLQNSIVAGNTLGGNCYGTMTSHGYNLSSDGTCTFKNTGDLNKTNPKLGTLQYNGGPTQTRASALG